MKIPTETEILMFGCVLSFMAGGVVASAIEYVSTQGNVVCVSRQSAANTGCTISQSNKDLRPGESLTVCRVERGETQECEVRMCLGEVDAPPRNLILAPAVGTRRIEMTP